VALKDDSPGAMINAWGSQSPAAAAAAAGSDAPRKFI